MATIFKPDSLIKTLKRCGTLSTIQVTATIICNVENDITLYSFLSTPCTILKYIVHISF